MLTNNYIRVLEEIFWHGTDISSEMSYCVKLQNCEALGLKMTDGTTPYHSSRYGLWTKMAYGSGVLAPNYWTVAAGSGSTAATGSDYCLETPVDGLSFSRSNSSNAYSGPGSMVYLTGITITNPTDADVTIQEIGLFAEIGYATMPGSSMVYNRLGDMLMVRQVLEAPLTIPANSAGSVTVTVGLSIP